MEIISAKDALEIDCLFVDVRSPGEFERERIPGAINIPVLDDEERAIVGTMYKQVSKEQAIEKGFGLFEKKVPEIVKKLKDISKPIVIYCWRGGMRSKAVVELFSEKKVYQLKGGYKDYRAWVRQSIETYSLKSSLVVVYGMTCVNKTKILQDFPNFLDLEGLAQHRGSVFGAVGLQPRTQKMFESLFLDWLEKNDGKFKSIIVEGESRKIGNTTIPEFFFKAMKKGTIILLKAPMEKRAKVFVTEYFNNSSIPELKTITLSLTKYMGKKLNSEAILLLDKEDLEGYAKLMCKKYYDPLYEHTFNQNDFKYVVEEEELRQILKSEFV
jgi:tRNA 2-selenouridine synthase